MYVGVPNLSSTIKGEQTVGGLLKKCMNSAGTALNVVIDKGKAAVKEFLFKGKDKRNAWDKMTPWDTKNEKKNRAEADSMENMAKRSQREVSALISAKRKVESNAPDNKSRNTGTLGATGQMFENFGSGTGVTLHGSEAVVPEKSMFGSLLSGFQKIQKAGGAVASAAKGAIGNAVSGGGGGGADLSQLVAGINATAENTSKFSADLNKLVAINMATERNTKSMTRQLANAGGDIL